MGGAVGGVFGTILYFGLIIGLMWFLIIRPQKKREKSVQEMQNSVKPGDSILTAAGTYGKVVDIVNDVLIVEFGLNKSVRIPVQKNYVAAIKEPELSTKKVEETTTEQNEDEKTSK